MNAFCQDLGVVDYKTCWELQQSLFDKLRASKASLKAAGTDIEKGHHTSFGENIDAIVGTALEVGPQADVGTILLVEHPPVYTLGKSGHAENLLIDRAGLERLGAQFFHIDRGGDITFHGPGQLVCYPILDLERIGIGLREYIGALEDAVIRTVAEYGIEAGRIADASGVWVSEPGRMPHKICAIGVRSSRHVTMHGFALNVSTDLQWFSRINPCGFTDKGATSMERETGHSIPMDEVKSLVVKFLRRILNVKIYNN